jgi:hypothetical protein
MSSIARRTGRAGERGVEHAMEWHGAMVARLELIDRDRQSRSQLRDSLDGERGGNRRFLLADTSPSTLARNDPGLSAEVHFTATGVRQSDTVAAPGLGSTREFDLHSDERTDAPQEPGVVEDPPLGSGLQLLQAPGSHWASVGR